MQDLPVPVDRGARRENEGGLGVKLEAPYAPRQEVRSPEVVVVEQRDVFAGATPDEQCLVAGGAQPLGSLCVGHARISQVSLDKRFGLVPAVAVVRDPEAQGAEALSKYRLDRPPEVHGLPPGRDADVDGGLRCRVRTHSVAARYPADWDATLPPRRSMTQFPGRPRLFWCVTFGPRSVFLQFFPGTAAATATART